MKRTMLARARGSTLLTVVSLLAVLLLIVAGLIAFANTERSRATQKVRQVTQTGCAEAGLEVATAYFGQNFSQWNNYLAIFGGAASPFTSINNPGTVDTTPSTGKLAKLQAGSASIPSTLVNGVTTAAVTSAQQIALMAPLFVDLDGDGNPDAFIYIRDNLDELVGTNIPNHDNDQNVIVGAICISSTMAPKRDDNTVSKDRLTLEGLLSYNNFGNRNYKQAESGDGSGNQNGR